MLVTPTAAGSINNTVSVAATETDPNPGNNTATENTTVEAPSSDPLNIIDVSPDVLVPGDVAQLTVSGTGFEVGADIEICRNGGVSIDSFVVVDANTILINVTVAADRLPGICGVRVVNPDGEADILVPAFITE